MFTVSFRMLFETIIYMAKYFKSSLGLPLEYAVILLPICIMYNVQEVGGGNWKGRMSHLINYSSNLKW